MADPLLQIDNLSISFEVDGERLSIVDGVSFDIYSGETVALVGESGCGKSLTALATMGLIDPPGRIDSGSIRLGGEELTRLDELALQDVRGRRIGMVFQEPMAALNPVFSVGQQISEVLIRHLKMDRKQARDYSLNLLDKVGIPSPEHRIDQYAHELSGGMQQRIMIAMALACKPELLIADEPTTALDVTIQAQILNLLEELQAEMGMAVLLISHDLGVVANVAQRVVAMYAGRIAEVSGVEDLFDRPLHPYTQLLLKSLPSEEQEKQRLSTIEGTVPRPQNYPTGCRFSNRCPQVLPKCLQQVPMVTVPQPGQQVGCWLYG
ncbi:ABC transporter ATP-binding protein [Pseudomonadota bacterium]